MKHWYHIFFLLSSVIAYGQVNIVVETNKRDFTDNEKVIVDVLLEISGKEMVQETPLRLFDTSKFEIIANGSNQNTLVDPKTGFVINQVMYRYELKPKDAGKIKIGSASVKVNGKLYYTEPFDIFVIPSDKKTIEENTNNDIFLSVELKDNEVYENQPITAILKAYSRNLDNFRKVKNIQLPKQNNINVTPISFQKSEIEASRNGNAASQILAVFLIFPNESGRLELPPVSANIYTKDNKIISNKLKINVLNLPNNAPEEYKNAVGKFEVKITSSDTENIQINKPFDVILKLSGEGNLANIDLPKISDSPYYSVFPPKISSNLVSSEEGTKGEITAKYVVIPKKKGAITISTENFSYFDPLQKKYVDLGRKNIVINALTQEEILAKRTPLERVNEFTNTVLQTVDNPVLQTENLIVTEKKSINWSALLINSSLLLTAFLGFLLFKNLQKNKYKNSNNTKRQPLGTLDDAEKEIKANLKADVQDYFAYMKGLVEREEYQKFFETFDEMDLEVRKEYFQNNEKDFKNLLEKHKGQQVAEQYHNITQKVKIEKYAPMHSPEQMNELLDAIVDLYSQISK